MMMISKVSKGCKSTKGGETLEKSLIHFEENVSTSLSAKNVYAEHDLNYVVSQQDSNNRIQNISASCECLENDIMRLYPNNQKKFGPYYSSQRYYYTPFTTKRKLLFLVFVASLALLSIVLISEQLIVRHLGRNYNDGENIIYQQVEFNPYQQVSLKTEFDILTLEEWAEHETLDFQDNVIHSQGNLPNKKDSSIVIESKSIEEANSRPSTFSNIVEDGIFWSTEVEAAVPPGPSDQQVLIQIQELRDRKVKSLESPNWLHCGRQKNRFIHFEDGSNACARYRGADHVEFIQGELMAFYLARLLGISNTPAVILSETNATQWNKLTSSNKRNWTGVNEGNSAVVALIEWLPDLTKTTMPYVLLNKLEKLETKKSEPNPLDGSELKSLSENEQEDLDEHVLSDLVQWSDLIMFDYLTGNYDRVASMQDGADHEKRPAILHETIHNLAKSSKTESLWLLDNESAFLDAYSLLYAKGGQAEANGKRFQTFHQNMLETTCVFRRKTVNRLYALYKSSDPSQLLLQFVSDNEPLFKTRLPTIHENSLFMQHFKERVDSLWNWIRKCQLNINQY